MPKGSRGGAKLSRGGGNNSPYDELEQRLLIGLSESNRGELYIHVGKENPKYITDKKYHNEGTVKSFKNIAKYDNILVNENLSKVTGTEKQIKYANDLRIKEAKNAVNLIDKAVGGKIVDEGTRYKKIDESIKTYNKQFNKKFSSKSEIINYTLNNSPQFKRWQKAKKMTSAKEIIELLR